MSTSTTASWPIEDKEKARYLAFDPTYYETLHDLEKDDDPTGLWFSPSSLAPTKQESAFETFDYDTVSLTSEQLSRVAELICRSEETIAALFHYTIESSLSGAKKATFPTRDPEGSLAELIDRFRQQMKIGYAKRIADRLDYLLEVSREEFPDQAPPMAGSLKSFLAFLRKNPELDYPDVVLTFSGNVRSEWTRGPNEHFAIEFCEDENVRFVIFAPDPKHPYKTSRVSGTATIDSVLGLAEYYQVSRWVMAEVMQAA